MRRVSAEREAQATVELAVVLPVLLVLSLIAYNLMTFAAATARFNHVVADIVIAQAVSPGGGDTVDASSIVRRHLERAMEGYDVGISVDRTSGDGGAGTLLSLVGGLSTYRCTMRFVPWPGALSIAGVRLGAPVELVHERSVTIDPWRPGVVL